MTDLLDMMRAPPIRRPVDPDGHVVQGDVDEVLSLPRPRNVNPIAEIEMHRADDGLWMWSASYLTEDRYRGYRVGEKWGKFAATRDDALYWAAQELIADIQRAYHGGRGPLSPLAKRAIAWAEGLA